MIRFKLAFSAAIAVAATATFAKPAAAIEYPWCAQYGGWDVRQELRLRELRTMYGNDPRHGRLLRAKPVLHRPLS